MNRQLPLWMLRTFAPCLTVRLVAGLPKGFALSSADARFVTEFIDTLFPVSWQETFCAWDATTSQPAIVYTWR